MILALADDAPDLMTHLIVLLVDELTYFCSGLVGVLSDLGQDAAPFINCLTG